MSAVRSGANTDGSTTADGSATTGGSLGVGVAVAINLATVDNIARVNGTIDAQGLTVDAAMIESGLDDVWRSNGTTWERVPSGDELAPNVVHRFNEADDEWQAVEVVDELPLSVLHRWDNPTGQWIAVPTGDTLPTGPGNGDFFNLTAAVTVPAALAAGVYRWNGTAWVAPAVAPTSGATFPDMPAADALFFKTPAVGDTVVFNDTARRWDGATWTTPAVTAGSAFPEAPSDADLFSLTPMADTFFELRAQDGTNAPGVYRFSDMTNQWVAVAGPVATGTALPADAGTADDLFRAAEHKFGASATSGAGGGVAVAVSLALNIVNLETIGELTDTADVTLDGGALNLGAASNGASFVEALPKDKVAGGSLGFGASVALNIVNDDAIARVAPQASIDVLTATSMAIDVRGGHAMSTVAKAGASADGIALVPAVAIAISNIDRFAQVLNDGTAPTLTIGGDLRISVDSRPAETGSHVRAEGAAEAAGSAAVGVALALNLVKHNVRVDLSRSVTTTGDVTIEAFGQSANSAVAVASAAGAPASSADDPANGESRPVDEQVTDARDGANAQATDAGSEGAGTEAPPSAKTSSGTITVAAAIAVNLVNTKSLASIPAAITVTAGGKVAIRTSANTDASSTADGSATNGGSLAVGLAVAINLANIDNQASVEGTVVAGGGLEVSASMSDHFGDEVHESGASAVSGASGGGVSIAVSFALNIVNVDTQGRVLAGSDVTITGGGIELRAVSVGSAVVSATPSNPVAGGSLGIGGSVALNLITDTAVAEVEDGATFNVNSADDVASVIEALGGHNGRTTAEAGAGSSGVSLAPAIAITLSNVTRTARIGGTDTDPITLGGSLTIAGRAPPSENTAITSAKGSATSSGSVAFGVAFALTIANHTFTATTTRNIIAVGDVTFEAFGRSKIDSTALAAAAGEDKDNTPAPADDRDGNPTTGVTGLINGERNAADDQATANGGADSGGTPTPKAQSSQGPISIAGAVAISITTTDAIATIPVGVTIESGGKVTVASKANTDSEAEADGSATKGGSVGVGIAVAINVADVTNSARVLGTVVADDGLTVDAAMIESDLDDVWHWNGTSWDRVPTGDALPASVINRYSADDDAWQAVPTVDELPTAVLHRWDADAGQWVEVDSGDTLPTGPGDGDFFNLTAAVTVPAALGVGIYRWNAGTSTWVAQAAPMSGETFPDMPAADTLFTKTPAADDVVVFEGVVRRWNSGTMMWDTPVVASGAEFPATPADGDLHKLTPATGAVFALTADDDQGNSAGVYKFDGTDWVELTTPASSGTALPTTAAADALFRLAEHKLGASATSGAGGGVAVAISFALNVADLDTLGQIATGADVTVNGGDIAIGAQSNASSTAAALPKDKVLGGSVGIGASVALNIVNDDAIAEIAQDAAVDSAAADSVTLQVRGGHTMSTIAKAGAAADGFSLVPAIAIAISNIDRIARIETDGANELEIDGSLTVAVDTTASPNGSTAVAEGAAEAAGSAAIGIALGLNIANHKVIAVTHRNVVASGDVTISATGQSANGASAKASSAGAPGSGQAGSPDGPGGSGDLNGQIAAERGAADTAATDNGSTGSTGSPATPEAKTSQGPITVAAAVAVNLATTLSSAVDPRRCGRELGWQGVGQECCQHRRTCQRRRIVGQRWILLDRPGRGYQSRQHRQHRHRRRRSRSHRRSRSERNDDRLLRRRDPRPRRRRHLGLQWWRRVCQCAERIDRLVACAEHREHRHAGLARLRPSSPVTSATRRRPRSQSPAASSRSGPSPTVCPTSRRSPPHRSKAAASASVVRSPSTSSTTVRSPKSRPKPNST